MVDRPDPDKPGLPQLRRFRIPADQGGQAHEVSTPSGAADAQTSGSTPYAAPDGDETELLSPNDIADDDYSLDDPDTLLRETDESLGHGGDWTPTPPPGPTTSPDAGPDATTPLPSSSATRIGGMNAATAPVAHTPPPASADGGQAGWAHAPGGVVPPGPPTGNSAGGPPDQPKKTSKLPIIIGVVAAVALAAILLWLFVFDSSGDEDNKNDAPVETTTTVEPTEPSDGGSGEPGRDDDKDMPTGGSGEPEPQPSGGGEDEPTGSGGNGGNEDDGGVRTTDGKPEPTMPGASAGPTSMPSGGSHSSAGADRG